MSASLTNSREPAEKTHSWLEVLWNSEWHCLWRLLRRLLAILCSFPLRAGEWGPMFLGCCVEMVLPAACFVGSHSSSNSTLLGYNGNFQGQILHLKFSPGPVNPIMAWPMISMLLSSHFFLPLLMIFSPTGERWPGCTVERVYICDYQTSV